MTTPNQPRPSTAYIVGSTYGAEITSESAFSTLRGRDLGPWQSAQDSWRNVWAQRSERLAHVVDSQNALINRVDLLTGIDGFASAFMANNWTVSPRKTVMLPYNRQLGPARKASVAADGRIVLKSGGLWRIDAHATLSGYTLNQMVVPIPTPPYFTVVTTYDPIAPKFWIEVVTSRGEFLTVRACDSLPNVATYAAGLAQVVANPFSTTFTHTFVLDEMPAEADPAAPDHWAYARLTMRYDPINTAHFADARCTVTGGTASSALVACRWSRDVHHRHYVPDVPDGGDLQ